MSGQLKEVRDRMKSVRSTQQITKAMKMVSAAKLRKAQEAITQNRPYAERVHGMLRNILSNVRGSVSGGFATDRVVKNALVVAITSDRGLCGAFNSNVIKAAISAIEGKYSQQRADGKLHILCVGKKGYDFFRKRYTDCHIIDNFVELFQSLDFNAASEVAQFIMDGFEVGDFDAVEVAYGRFKNPATQYPELVRYLPVQKLAKDPRVKTRADYIFEPDQETLLHELIPAILKVQFNSYMLDTHASEHGARMTAMDKASENAEELLKELRLSYNKARQEAITKELSEIVGGAAALGG